MITKETIATGIERSAVRFVEDPNMGSGTVCQIGDNWFYFGGETAEGCTPKEYVNATPRCDLIQEVYVALEGLRAAGEEDEYRYYDTYLTELTVRAKATTQSIPTLQQRDDTLEALWEQLADVPVDPDTEKLEEQYIHFPAGTVREDVWHWFDERHSKGVAYLLYRDGVDRTDTTSKLLYLKQLCTECEAEHCVFNPQGICKLPFVTGAAPRLSDDGCADYCYKEEL